MDKIKIYKAHKALSAQCTKSFLASLLLVLLSLSFFVENSIIFNKEPLEFSEKSEKDAEPIDKKLFLVNSDLNSGLEESWFGENKAIAFLIFFSTIWPEIQTQPPESISTILINYTTTLIF